MPPDKMILCVTMPVFVMLFAFFNLLLKKCQYYACCKYKIVSSPVAVLVFCQMIRLAK